MVWADFNSVPHRILWPDPPFLSFWFPITCCHAKQSPRRSSPAAPPPQRMQLASAAGKHQWSSRILEPPHPVTPQVTHCHAPVTHCHAPPRPVTPRHTLSRPVTRSHAQSFHKCLAAGAPPSPREGGGGGEAQALHQRFQCVGHWPVELSSNPAI